MFLSYHTEQLCRLVRKETPTDRQLIGFVTIRITNRCDFLYYVFISFFSSFPYMFRAFMGPSSGVFQAVVFKLPFGSCSALLVVCVHQRPLTHADDQQSTA